MKDVLNGEKEPKVKKSGDLCQSFASGTAGRIPSMRIIGSYCAEIWLKS